MILADHEIARLAQKFGMITPFTERMVKIKEDRPCLGFGLDSAGYDLRLADEVQVFSWGAGGRGIIDPKNFDSRLLSSLRADEEGRIFLPPMTTALGHALEHIKMPDNVSGLAFAKSTYARCGLTLNTTKLVPGWEGDLVLEMSNITPFPSIVYVGEGIISVQFFWVNPPDALYVETGGGYHNQKGVTLPKT